MRYPKECPVFESDDGDIIQIVGLPYEGLSTSGFLVDCWVMHAYNGQWRASPRCLSWFVSSLRKPNDPWSTRPLTESARDMLALVTP